MKNKINTLFILLLALVVSCDVDLEDTNIDPNNSQTAGDAQTLSSGLTNTFQENKEG